MIEVLANPPTATLERPGAACPSRPLRVCYLIDDLGTGGTEHQLLSLLRHLDRNRVQPRLCILRGLGRRSQVMEPAGVPIQRLGVGALKHPSTFGKLARFVQFLRRAQIDVLQIYFTDSSYFGVVAGRLAGVRTVLRTRINLADAATPGQRWLRRWCTRLAHGTVTNSAATRDAAQQLDAARTVFTIENGVEMARFADLPSLDARRMQKRIGLVANLRAVKDPATLVRAAQQVVVAHPAATFHIAGEGEERSRLETLIAELGLQERVLLRGDLKDIPQFLGSIDVAVLCSLSEGFSNAVLEYMAAGRAIVATAVGGNLQLLRDGQNGLLVPPGDPAALAGAIRRLLEHPDLALRLARAARHDAQQRHDAVGRARRFEDLYAALATR